MKAHYIILAFLAAGFAVAPVSAGVLKEKVTVSKKDCRRMVRHRPAADVAYKPGVDVRGRPVKSANLDGDKQIDLPAVIAIPLHVPLGNLLKKGSSTPVDASEVGVGVVTVDRKTGEVMYEGKSLGNAETQQMVAACRKLLRGK
ncbi:MAG: hypothetical protein HOA08_17885 [Rhodospirillaceae bacterium]|mgnify:FL=1|jgi:hypothetical protein|nr:hypothetical protein [Rhodospirillaceae bacterium]MBT3490749.1 hypothetical protein [Rhodospirillaceae bacterium]MBT3783052.1 hypothetical protein [Rhodospirillaceae bacterium]MBT3976353.1 hypothetical protein [Rhodospirillaceae bacterium]MBT4169904.1 hypothetical protein [Rhodospirillaceae bacterium]